MNVCDQKCLTNMNFNILEKKTIIWINIARWQFTRMNDADFTHSSGDVSVYLNLKELCLPSLILRSQAKIKTSSKKDMFTGENSSTLTITKSQKLFKQDPPEVPSKTVSDTLSSRSTCLNRNLCTTSTATEKIQRDNETSTAD